VIRALVVDASPLIALAKIDCLDFLSTLAQQVIVPNEVAAEIIAGPKDDPARLAVEAGWGERRALSAVPSAVLEWSLGRGETAVVGLAAKTPHSLAVLDDAEARRCARALRVACIGTLGIVLRCAAIGTIPGAVPVLRALKAAGLHLDDSVVREALSATTGESWPG
jgi:predicted nucleic acid-binding protein